MATEVNNDMTAETGGDNSNDNNSDDHVETFIFKNLQYGFRSIRRRRSSTLPAAAVVAVNDQQTTSASVAAAAAAAAADGATKTVLVNFIDPSSVSGSIVAASGSTAVTTTSTSSQTPPRPQPLSSQLNNTKISLYQRLSTIFERDYKNTLHQLPYQDVLRSKVLNIIDAIQIQCMLSPGVFLTDDVLARLSKNADDHHGSNAATYWHEGPYCNIYLAACESLEEYRTKVKPSVQAFVSQIESTNKDGAYVIVYCPNISSKSSSSGDDGKSGGGATASSSSRVGSLANRIRQRMGRDTIINSNNTNTTSNSSTHSTGNASSPAVAASSPSSLSSSPGPTALTDSMHSGTAASTNSAEFNVDTEDDNNVVALASSSSTSSSTKAAPHLTKIQKELVRRFAADFSHGHVCTLSTLWLDAAVDDDVVMESPLQKQEWSHFMKALGSAVVEGFQERCRRLDEVLRKMDAQRGGGPKAGSTTDGGGDDIGGSGTTTFNLSQFFLIKESLAFTYEQMNLPAEALMQYNELRALLPDIRTDKDLEAIQGGPNDVDLLSGIEGAETTRRRRPSTGGCTGSGGGGGSASGDDQMSQLATASDIVAFRQRLRDLTDLRIIAPAIEEYIYGREVSLLFQIGDPVEVIRRSLHFVSTMFNFRSNQIKNLSENARRERSIEMERWAFKFCWDLKRAADAYLGMDAIEDAIAATEHARGRGTETRESQSSWSATSMVTIGNESTSAAISSVLEKRPKASMETFARHVCDVMGYARLRLIRLADLVLAEENIMTRLGFEAVPADIRKPWPPWSAPSNAPPSTPNKYGIRNMRSGESFLEDAFESKEAFQSRFLDVMKVAIALNTFAGRYRCAARLNLDAVEIFLRRGETHEAVNALQKIAAVYARDQWMACNFLLLFRLAGFQRQIGSPRDYLTTLVQSFHGHAAAPPIALEALQTDLEAVASAESTSGVAFPDPPLFVPLLGLRDQRHMPGATGRKLVRKVYNVGDHAGILLALTSHLPRNIDDVTIKVDLVPYHVYVSCLEDSVPITQEHVSQTLSLDGPVMVQPGRNDFVFEWTPISSGQYIVAMIEIEWRGIQFTYKSKEVLKPTIRVDILPREPTQSIQAKPVFLLPGHEQPIRIEFSSGSDIVERGELQLACSPGLVLLPPGEDRSSSDKWCSMLTMDLPLCPPGETVVLVTSVRSSSDPDSDDTGPPTVHAKVTTQYQYFPPDLSDGNVKKQASACSENVLEAVLTTLGNSALSVSDVHLTTYAVGRSLLGISLKCHTPTPFVLKSWKLRLPSYLVLDESPFAVDINASLVDTMIVDHDQVNFGFHCKHCVADHSKSTHATLVVDVQDEYGSVFSEKLEIRLARISIPKTELPDIQSVSVKIQPSSEEGNVGSSIDLDYVVDTTVFAGWKGRVSYSVDTDSDDWFVSGNIQGIVDTSSSSFTLSLVAIPTRPGVIKLFPTMSLSLDEEGLEKPVPLTVFLGGDGTHGQFHALAPPVTSAVAFLEQCEV